MEELGSLFVGLALLILLAATSMRFGVDSRDGFRGSRGHVARGGILSDAPSSAPTRLTLVPKRENRLAAEPATCGLTPCAA